MLAILPATSATAQEKGQVGVTMGYPATVGVLWQVADRVAVRPEISLSQNSGTATSTRTISVFGQVQTTETQVSSDNMAVGTGVSGLFYLWKREAVSMYVTPRYTYTRVTSSQQLSFDSLPELVTTSHFISGSFGAQYALGRRFAVFGEIGIGYTRTAQDSSSTLDSSPVSSSITSRTVTTTRGVSTRSAAGVVLYFR